MADSPLALSVVQWQVIRSRRCCIWQSGALLQVNDNDFLTVCWVNTNMLILYFWPVSSHVPPTPQKTVQIEFSIDARSSKGSVVSTFLSNATESTKDRNWQLRKLLYQNIFLPVWKQTEIPSNLCFDKSVCDCLKFVWRYLHEFAFMQNLRSTAHQHPHVPGSVSARHTAYLLLQGCPFCTATPSALPECSSL